MRLGRQTRNSSGVLGRFDGILLGYQAKSNLRFNLVGGFPVLTSRQTYVLKDRYFYGASVDVGAKQSPLQTTLYWFDQRSKGGFGQHFLAVARYGAPVWNIPEVVLFLRNPPTNATARIGHVTRVSWDDMEVEMRDGLARRVPEHAGGCCCHGAGGRAATAEAAPRRRLGRPLDHEPGRPRRRRLRRVQLLRARRG